MGIPKEQFKDRDVFIDYDYEDVMFRYDYATRSFYRKFYGESEENEVLYDNGLLNDAMIGGEEIDITTYLNGKQLNKNIMK